MSVSGLAASIRAATGKPSYCIPFPVISLVVLYVTDSRNPFFSLSAFFLGFQWMKKIHKNYMTIYLPTPRIYDIQRASNSTWEAKL